MARWILRYETSCRGYVPGKSWLEKKPPGGAFFAANTRECSVILARTVSAPLGCRGNQYATADPAHVAAFGPKTPLPGVNAHAGPRVGT